MGDEEPTVIGKQNVKPADQGSDHQMQQQGDNKNFARLKRSAQDQFDINDHRHVLITRSSFKNDGWQSQDESDNAADGRA